MSLSTFSIATPLATKKHQTPSYSSQHPPPTISAPAVNFNYIPFSDTLEAVQQATSHQSIISIFNKSSNIFLNLSAYFSRCTDVSLAQFKSLNPSESNDNTNILLYANLINFSPLLIQFHFNELKKTATSSSTSSSDSTSPTIDMVLYAVYHDLVSCLKLILFFCHLFSTGYQSSSTTLSSHTTSLVPTLVYTHTRNFLYTTQLASATTTSTTTSTQPSTQSTNFVSLFFSLISLLSLLLAPQTTQHINEELSLHNEMIANSQPLPWFSIKADYTIVAQSILLTILTMLTTHLSTSITSNNHISQLFPNSSQITYSTPAEKELASERNLQLQIHHQIAATLPLIFSLISTTTFGLSQSILQYTTSKVSLSSNSSQQQSYFTQNTQNTSQLDHFSTLLVNFTSTTDNLDILLSNIPYLFTLIITNILPLQLSAEIIALGQQEWSIWQKTKSTTKSTPSISFLNVPDTQNDDQDDWDISQSLFSSLIWYFNSVSTNVSLLEFIDQMLTSFHVTITTPVHPCYTALSLLMVSTTLHLSNYVSLAKITYDAFPFDLSSHIDTSDLYSGSEGDLSFHLYNTGSSNQGNNTFTAKKDTKRLLLARLSKKPLASSLNRFQSTFLGEQGLHGIDTDDPENSHDGNDANHTENDAFGTSDQNALDPFSQFAFQRLGSMAVQPTTSLLSPSYYRDSESPISFTGFTSQPGANADGGIFFQNPQNGQTDQIIHPNQDSRLFSPTRVRDGQNHLNLDQNNQRNSPNGINNNTSQDTMYNTSALATDDYDIDMSSIGDRPYLSGSNMNQNDWAKHVKIPFSSLCYRTDSKQTHQSTFQQRIMYTIDHLQHFLTIISDRLAIALELQCFQRMLTHLPSVHTLESVLNGFLIVHPTLPMSYEATLKISSTKFAQKGLKQGENGDKSKAIGPNDLALLNAQASMLTSSQNVQWYHSIVLHSFIAIIIALFHSQCYYPCISTPSTTSPISSSQFNNTKKTIIGVQGQGPGKTHNQSLNLTLSAQIPSPSSSASSNFTSDSNEYNILTVLAHLIQFYTQTTYSSYSNQLDHYSLMYRQFYHNNPHVSPTHSNPHLPHPPQINFLVQTIAFRCFGPLIWNYSPISQILTQNESNSPSSDHNDVTLNEMNQFNNTGLESSSHNNEKMNKRAQVDAILDYAHNNPTSLIHQYLLHFPLMCLGETMSILSSLALFYPILIERILANFDKFTTIVPLDALSLKELDSPDNQQSIMNSTTVSISPNTDEFTQVGFGKGLIVYNKYPLLVDNCLIIPPNTTGTIVSITLPHANYVTTTAYAQNNDTLLDSQSNANEMCIVVWHHRWNVLKFITNRLLTPIPSLMASNNVQNPNLLNFNKTSSIKSTQTLSKTQLNITYNTIQSVFMPYLSLLATITRYRYLKAPQMTRQGVRMGPNGPKNYLDRYCTSDHFSTLLMLAMFMVVDKNDTFCLNVPVGNSVGPFIAQNVAQNGQLFGKSSRQAQNNSKSALSAANHHYVQSVATLMNVAVEDGPKNRKNGPQVQIRNVICLTQASVAPNPSLVATIHQLLGNHATGMVNSPRNSGNNQNTTSANASFAQNNTTMNTSLLNTTAAHLSSSVVQTTLYDTHSNAQYITFYNKNNKSHFAASFFYLFSYACFTNLHQLTQAIVSLYPLLTTSQSSASDVIGNSNFGANSALVDPISTITTLQMQQTIHDPVLGMFVPFSLHSIENYNPLRSQITTHSPQDKFTPTQNSILAQVFHSLLQYAYQLQDTTSSTTAHAQNEFATLFSTPLFTSYLTQHKIYARLYDSNVSMDTTHGVFIPTIESPTSIIVGCLDHFISLALSIHFTFNMPPEYIQHHQREQQEAMAVQQIYGPNSISTLNSTFNSTFNSTQSPANSTMMISMMKKRQNGINNTTFGALTTVPATLPIPLVQELPIMCTKSTITQLLSVAISLMNHFMHVIKDTVGDISNNSLAHKINFLTPSHIQIVSQIAHILITTLFFHPHILFTLLDTSSTTEGTPTNTNTTYIQNGQFFNSSFFTTIIGFLQSIFNTFIILTPYQNGKVEHISGIRLSMGEINQLFTLCASTLTNFSTFFATTFTHATAIIASIELTIQKGNLTQSNDGNNSNVDNNSLVSQSVTLNAYSDEYYPSQTQHKVTSNKHQQAYGDLMPSLSPITSPQFSTFPILLVEAFLTSNFITNTLSAFQYFVNDESNRFKAKLNADPSQTSSTSSDEQQTYICPFDLNIDALHSTYMIILRQIFTIFDVISTHTVISNSPLYSAYINTSGFLTVNTGNKYNTNTNGISILQTPHVMHEIHQFHNEISIALFRTIFSLLLRDCTLPWYPIAKSSTTDDDLAILFQNTENGVNIYYDDLRKEVVSIAFSLISTLRTYISKSLWDVFIKDVKDDDKVLQKLQKHNKSLLHLLSMSSSLLFDSLGYVWEQDITSINIAVVIAFLVVEFTYHNDHLHNSALFHPLNQLPLSYNLDEDLDYHQYNAILHQQAHQRIVNTYFSSTLVQKGAEIIAWAIESQLCKSLYPALSPFHKMMSTTANTANALHTTGSGINSTNAGSNQGPLKLSAHFTIENYLSINIHDFWEALLCITQNYATYQTQAILHFFPSSSSSGSKIASNGMGTDLYSPNNDNQREFTMCPNVSTRNVTLNAPKRDLLNESILFDEIDTFNTSTMSTSGIFNQNDAIYGMNLSSNGQNMTQNGSNTLNTTFNSTYLPVPDQSPSYERTMTLSEVDRVSLHALWLNFFQSVFSILHSVIVVSSSTSNNEIILPTYNPLIYVPIKRVLMAVQLSSIANVIVKLLSQPLPQLDTRVIDRLLGFDIRSTSGVKYHLKQLLNSNPTTTLQSHHFVSNLHTTTFTPFISLQQSGNPYISTLIQSLFNLGPTSSLLLDQTASTHQHQHTGFQLSAFNSLEHVDKYITTLQHYNLQLYALSTFSTLIFNACNCIKFIQTINSLPNISQSLPILSIAKTLIYNFYTPLIPASNDLYDTICDQNDPQNEQNGAFAFESQQNPLNTASMSFGSHNADKCRGGRAPGTKPDQNEQDIFMYHFDDNEALNDDMSSFDANNNDLDGMGDNTASTKNTQMDQNSTTNEEQMEKMVKFSSFVNTINKQIKLNTGVTPLSLYISKRLLPFLFSSFLTNFHTVSNVSTASPQYPSKIVNDSTSFRSDNDTSSITSPSLVDSNRIGSGIHRQPTLLLHTPTIRSSTNATTTTTPHRNRNPNYGNNRIDEIDDFSDGGSQPAQYGGAGSSSNNTNYGGYYDHDDQLSDTTSAELNLKSKNANSTHLLTCLLLTLLTSHGITASIPISPSLYVDLDTINTQLLTALVLNDDGHDGPNGQNPKTSSQSHPQPPLNNLTTPLKPSKNASPNNSTFNTSIFNIGDDTIGLGGQTPIAPPTTMIRTCLDAALSQLNVHLPELVQYAKFHNYIDTSFITQHLDDHADVNTDHNLGMNTDAYSLAALSFNTTHNPNTTLFTSSYGAHLTDHKMNKVIKNTIYKLSTTFELAFDTKVHAQNQYALYQNVQNDTNGINSGLRTIYSKQYIIEYLLSKMNYSAAFPTKYAAPDASTQLVSQKNAQTGSNGPQKGYTTGSGTIVAASGSLFDYLITQHENSTGLTSNKHIVPELASDNSGINNIMQSFILTTNLQGGNVNFAKSSSDGASKVNIIDFIMPLLSSLSITVPQMVQSHDQYMKQYATQGLQACSTCFKTYLSQIHSHSSASTPPFNLHNDTSRDNMSTSDHLSNNIFSVNDCIICKTASTSSPFIIAASLIPVLLQCLYIPSCVDSVLALILPLLQCVFSTHSLLKSTLAVQIQQYERKITLSQLNSTSPTLANTSFLSPIKSSPKHFQNTHDDTQTEPQLTHSTLISILDDKIYCTEALERINTLYSEVLGEMSLHFDYLLVLYKATTPQHVQRLCHIMTLFTTITTQIVQYNAVCADLDTVNQNNQTNQNGADSTFTKHTRIKKALSLDLVHIFTTIMTHPLLLDFNLLISIIHNSGLPHFKTNTPNDVNSSVGTYGTTFGSQSGLPSNKVSNFLNNDDISTFLNEQKSSTISLHYPLEVIHSMVFQYGEVFNSFYKTLSDKELAFYTIGSNVVQNTSQHSSLSKSIKTDNNGPDHNTTQNEFDYNQHVQKASRMHFSTFIAMIFNYFTTLIPYVTKMYPMEEVLTTLGQNNVLNTSSSSASQLTSQIIFSHVSTQNIYYTLFLHFISTNYNIINYNLVYLTNQHALNTAKTIQFFHTMDTYYPFWRGTYCYVQHPPNVVNTITNEHLLAQKSTNIVMNAAQYHHNQSTLLSTSQPHSTQQLTIVDYLEQQVNTIHTNIMHIFVTFHAQIFFLHTESVDTDSATLSASPHGVHSSGSTVSGMLSAKSSSSTSSSNALSPPASFDLNSPLDSSPQYKKDKNINSNSNSTGKDKVSGKNTPAVTSTNVPAVNTAVATVRANDSIFKNKYKYDTVAQESDGIQPILTNNAPKMDTKVKQSQLNLVLLLGLSLSQYVSTFTTIVVNIFKTDLQRLTHRTVSNMSTNSYSSNFAHPSTSTLASIVSTKSNSNDKHSGSFFSNVCSLLTRMYQFPFSLSFQQHHKTNVSAVIYNATIVNTNTALTDKSTTNNHNDTKELQKGSNRTHLRKNLVIPFRSYRDLLLANYANPDYRQNIINPSNGTGFTPYYSSTSQNEGTNVMPFHFSKSLFFCQCKPSLFYLHFLIQYIAKVIPLVTPTQRLLTILYPNTSTQNTLADSSLLLPSTVSLTPSSSAQQFTPLQLFTLDVNAAVRNTNGTCLQFVPTQSKFSSSKFAQNGQNGQTGQNGNLSLFINNMNTTNGSAGSINPNTSIVDYNTYLVQLYARDIFNTTLYSAYNTQLTNNLDMVSTTMMNIVKYNQSLQSTTACGPQTTQQQQQQQQQQVQSQNSLFSTRSNIPHSLTKTRPLGTYGSFSLAQTSSPQLQGYPSSVQASTVALPFLNTCEILSAKSSTLLTIQNLTQQYEQTLYTFTTHIAHIYTIDVAVQSLALSSSQDADTLNSNLKSTPQLLFGNIQYQNNPLQYIFNDNSAQFSYSHQNGSNMGSNNQNGSNMNKNTSSSDNKNYTSPLQFLLDSAVNNTRNNDNTTVSTIVKCPLQPLDHISLTLYNRMLKLTGVADFQQFSQMYTIPNASPDQDIIHSGNQPYSYIAPSPTTLFLFNHVLRIPELPQLVSNSIFAGTKSLLTPQQQQFIAIVQHIILKIHQSIILTPVSSVQTNISAKQFDLINNVPDVVYLQSIKRFASQIIAFYSNTTSAPSNISTSQNQSPILLTLFTSHLSLNIADFDSLLAHCGTKVQAAQTMSHTLSTLLHSHDSMFIPPNDINDIQSTPSLTLSMRSPTNRISSPTKSKLTASPTTHQPHRSGSSSSSTSTLAGRNNIGLVGLSTSDSNLFSIAQWFLPTTILFPSSTSSGSNDHNMTNVSIQQLITQISTTSNSSQSSFSSLMILQLLQQQYQCKHTIRIYSLINNVIKAILTEIAVVVQNDVSKQQQVHVLLQKQQNQPRGNQ